MFSFEGRHLAGYVRFQDRMGTNKALSKPFLQSHGMFLFMKRPKLGIERLDGVDNWTIRTPNYFVIVAAFSALPLPLISMLYVPLTHRRLMFT